MGRPLIGLTTYAEAQRLSGRDVATVSIPTRYVEAVNASGGRAVLIPSDDAGEDVLDHLDGIVLCGGSDLGPQYYGEEPHPSVVLTRPVRDAAEMLFVRAALARDLPLLGVCRGLQVMVVACGGRLHQHLPDALGSDRHRPAGGPRHGQHAVRLLLGSLGQRVLGDEVGVNSFHHQGVADPGRLKATGWCPDDGLIEVVEDPDRTFALGVQWHPEDTTDHRVYAALVQAAAARRPHSPASG
jgi:putative glutamine amidotransferase